MVPVSCLPTIHNLRYTSALSLLSILTVVLLVVSNSISTFAKGEYLGWSEVRWWNWSWDVFQAIPIITFSLTCHAQAVPIFSELDNPTDFRLRKVISLAYSVCFVLYSVNGSFGYLCFQGGIKDNVLNNFAIDDWVASVARFCVAVTLILSYPLMNYAFRTAFDFVIFTLGYQAIYGEQSADLPPEQNITRPTYLRYVVETVVAAVLCWVLNVAIPSISLGFGLVGSMTSSFRRFSYFRRFCTFL
jgi:amino acid permease